MKEPRRETAAPRQPGDLAPSGWRVGAIVQSSTGSAYRVGADGALRRVDGRRAGKKARKRLKRARRRARPARAA